MVNPDGVAHDIAGRQVPRLAQEPAADPGSTAKGTDLNRNFGYRWGGGGRTSSNPRAITYRGTEGVLDAGGPRVPGLPGEPRHRRPAADPDGHQLPRDRAPGDVAVRLHEDERAERHDRRRPRGAGPDRPEDGLVQRLQARAGERPLHHLGHVARLRVRDVPDLRVHDRDVGQAVLRSRRRSRRRPVGTRGPSCTSWSGRGVRSGPWARRSVPLAAARSTTTSRSRRGWTARPGRDRHGARRRRGSAGPTRQPTTRSGPKQRGTTTSGVEGVRHRREGRREADQPRPGRAARRCGRPSIALPATLGQRLTFRYVFAHDAASSAADSLRAIVEVGGVQTVVWSQVGAAVDVDGAWRTASDPDGRLRRPDGADPVRRGRRRCGQPGRGRDRRRAGDARVVGAPRVGLGGGAVLRQMPFARNLRRRFGAAWPADLAPSRPTPRTRPRPRRARSRMIRCARTSPNVPGARPSSADVRRHRPVTDPD